jgi:hypothetical protein
VLRRACGALMVTVIAVSGCYMQRVTIPPLPPTLTPEQRVDAFHRFRRHPEARMVMVTCSRNGGVRSCSESEILLLANGTQVHDPQDLLPLVPAESTTARSAKRSARNYGRVPLLWLGVVASIASGLVVSGKGAFNDDNTMMYSGFAILGVGALSFGTAAVIFGSRGNDARKQAFRHYTSDLASGLRVCMSGVVFVPCEASVSVETAAPPPPPPDPAIEELPQR